MSFVHLTTAIIASALLFTTPMAAAQKQQQVIIDTDIGDDIDDAFAIALALNSPDLKILGVTTAFGDTTLRAQLLTRLLHDTGHRTIPVVTGIPTKPATKFTQSAYGLNTPPPPSLSSAVDFSLDQIRSHPNKITLIALGPLTNIGAMIDKDPATFRKLRRVVLMGGSIQRGYDKAGNTVTPPDPEWNIFNDIPSAQKLFASGVSLYVMPLDATQIPLDEARRTRLFQQHTPSTDALVELYKEWGGTNPILFDPVTVAFTIDPTLCTPTPMHITIDGKGFTHQDAGKPNAQVCLHSNSEAFFKLFLDRVAPKT